MGLLLLFSTGMAQTIVKGKVIDKKTGEPLENAVVSARGKTVLTDEQGNFQLALTGAALSGAGDSIRASFVGYRQQSLDARDAGNP